MASGWGGISGEIERALEEKRRKEEEERRAEEIRRQFLESQRRELARQEEEKQRRNVSGWGGLNPILSEQMPASRPQPEPQAPLNPNLRPMGEPDLGPSIGLTRPYTDTGPADIGASQTQTEAPTVTVPSRSSRPSVPPVAPMQTGYSPAESSMLGVGPSYQRRTYQPAPPAPEPPKDPQQLRAEIFRTGHREPQLPAWMEQGAQWLGEQAQTGMNWLGDEPRGQAFGRAMGNLLWNTGQVGVNAAEWWRETPAYRYAQERSEDRLRDAGQPGLAAAARVTGPMISGIGDATGNLTLQGAGAAMTGIGTFINELGKTPLGQEVQRRGMDVLDRVLDVPQTILSDTRIPGADISLTEIVQPLGERLNQTLNPLNPNRTDDPYAVIGTVAGLLFAPKRWSAYYINQAKPEFDKARQAVAEAAKTNPDAVLALRNLVSGPEAVQQSLDLLINRDQIVQDKLAQAQEAEMNGDVNRATALYAEVQELQRKSPAQIVDESMNAWAEVVRGIMADPTTYVNPFEWLGLTVEAGKARQAANLFNVSPEEAARRFEQLSDPRRFQEVITMGGKQAQQAYNTYVRPYLSFSEKNLGWLWPLQRTAASKAELDANATYRATIQVLKDVDNKADIRTVLGTLAQQPERLVEGLTNLVGSIAQQVPGAPVRWDSGVVANEEFLRRFPIVQAVADRITQLPAIQGNGILSADDALSFQAQLYELYYDVSKRFNGVHVNYLPLGASKVDLVKNPDGTAALRYLDKEGKVLRTTEALPLAEAQTAYRQVKGDVQTSALKFLGQAAYFPFWLQKAIMSDVWLGFRPANWIGNALGGTTQLLANDSYTTLPRGNMIDHLTRQLGGLMPTPRVYSAETGTELSRFSKGAVSEAGGGLVDAVGRTVFRNANNPLSNLSRFMYDIPYGNNEIRIGNTAIPISEQNFALRAFYVPMQRTLNGLVKDSLFTDLRPTIEGLGIDPQAGQFVLDKVHSLAMDGSRSDIVRGLREWLGKPTLTPVLQSLGVSPETISANGMRRIEQLLADAVPGEETAIMQEIRKVLAGERLPALKLMDASGVHPGIRDWTDVDLTNEAAWLTKQLTDLPKGMDIGIDPKQLMQEAQTIAKQVVEARRGSLDRLLGDLPHAPNNPDTWSMLMDYLVEVFDSKTTVRQLVDEASRRAHNAGTPEAWLDKWNVTREAYGKLPDDLMALSDKYRVLLTGGQPYTRQFDWYSNLQKYLGFDEEEWRRLRGVGLKQLNEQGGLDMGQKLIDANRQYLDNGFWDMFSALQRYPSIENFDIVRDTINRVDAMGARTAATVADLRDQIRAGMNTSKQFGKQVSEQWTGYFDAAYHYTQEMTRAIVSQGLAPETATDLRWFDPQGQEWRLIGPSGKKGKYVARNADTGRIEEFTKATSLDEVGPFVVPMDVVDDLEGLASGKPAQRVEQVVQEITENRPPVVRTAEQYDRPALPGGLDMADRPLGPEPRPPQPVKAARQENMFAETGEDLPLMSGQAYGPAESASFQPQEVQRQEGMFDMRPQMGAAEPSYTPYSPGPVTEADYRDLTKKQIIERYGDVLAEQGYSKTQISRMSKRELDVALGRAEAVRPTTTGDLADEQIDTLRQTRDEMRDAWDREIQGHGKGIPTLDRLMFRFKRNGDVNLNLDKGEVKQFEDIYGRTVAGYKIENLDDLRAFLNDYSQTQEQIRAAEGVVGESKRFSRMSASEIVDATYDDWMKEGFTPDEIEELRRMDRRELLNAYEQNIQGKPLGDMVTYEYTVPIPDRLQKIYSGEAKASDNFYQLLGVEQNAPLKGTLADWVKRSRAANGATQTHIGDVAQYQVKSIDDLERKLAANIGTIVQGTPNQLTPGQILRVVDAVNDWLPKWDNAMAQAVHVGDQMAGWAMLNFADKRNIDSLLGLLSPFPYFWSRMPARVATNAMQKPGFVNAIYEIQRGISLENQQSGVPQRLEGTLPIYTDAQGNQQRAGVSNLFKYLMPSYWTPNYYVDEDEAGAALLRWIPGLYPASQAALDVLTTGKTDMTFGDMVPIPGVGLPVASVQQYATGDMQQQQEGAGGFFTNPSQWDPYRARRAIGNIAMQDAASRGDMTEAEWKELQATVYYANQVVRNQAEGRPVGEGIPPERLQAAQELAARGVQGAAGERMLARGTGYTSLVPIYSYPASEQQGRQLNQQYWASDYDPMTRQGSRGLQKEFLEQNPELLVGWAKGFDEPGESGRRTELYSELDKVRQERQAKVDALLQKNPNVDDQVIYDINNEYYQKEQALYDKYNVPPAQRSNNPTRGMNPREEATYRVEQILGYEPPGKPVYPDKGASDAEMRTYYAAKNEWDEKRMQWVESQLRTLAGAEQPYSGVDTQAQKLLSGQYSSDLLRREQNRYLSDTEYDYWERNAIQSEMESNQWQQRESVVEAALGKPGLDAYRKYMQADEETRKRLKAGNPLYGEVMEVAFNPQQYQQAVDLFGKDWYRTYANAPDHPGDEAGEAQLQAYYRKLDAYAVANPQYNGIRMWLSGRPMNKELSASLRAGVGGYSPRDYGKDYQAAADLFGPDIFQLAAQYNQAKNKGEGEKDAFMAGLSDYDRLRMRAYWGWYYEQQDMGFYPGYNPPANRQEAQARGVPYPQAEQAPDWRTYQGPRPIGSEATPVVQGGLQNPPGWVRGLGNPQFPQQPSTAGPQTAQTPSTEGPQTRQQFPVYQQPPAPPITPGTPPPLDIERPITFSDFYRRVDTPVQPLPGNEWADLMAQEEQKYGLPPGILQALAQEESAFSPDVIDGTRTSRAGAVGLMQFMPGTWKQVASDLGIEGAATDPEAAIPAAAYYLKTLYDNLPEDKKEWRWALAAYNWGPGNVASAKSWNDVPAETKPYATRIVQATEQPGGMPFEGAAMGDISQQYGANPEAYARFGLPGHDGVDWMIPTGTPIQSMTGGKVVAVATDPNGWGNYVMVQAPDGTYVSYAHLSQQDVAVGDVVEAGMQLGLSGGERGTPGAGNSSGPHLHVTVRQGGRGQDSNVNPVAYIQSLSQEQPPIRYEVLRQPQNVKRGQTVTMPNGGRFSDLPDSYRSPSPQQPPSGKGTQTPSKGAWPTLQSLEPQPGGKPPTPSQGAPSDDQYANLFSYAITKENYDYLVGQYGMDALVAWSKMPPYEDSEAGRQLRSQYYDENPMAFEINAWLYGRPGKAGERGPNDEQKFEYNSGKDYDQAKKLFGDDIWSVVAGYKRGWDKETKSAYFDANPQLSKFFDWWYANLPDTQPAQGGYRGYAGGSGYSGGDYDLNAEYNMDAYIAPYQYRGSNVRVGGLQGYRRSEGDTSWQRFLSMFGNGQDWRRSYR